MEVLAAGCEPLSEIEAEVTVALNVVLDIVTRRAIEADGRAYASLFEARDVLISEIQHRRLPLLAADLRDET